MARFVRQSRQAGRIRPVLVWPAGGGRAGGTGHHPINEPVSGELGGILDGIPGTSRAATTDGLLRDGDLAQGVIDSLRELNGIAKTRDQTLAQMSLSWVLRDARVTSALIGASRPEQISENVRAASADAVRFSTEDLAQIEDILAKVVLPESLWAGGDR